MQPYTACVTPGSGADTARLVPCLLPQPVDSWSPNSISTSSSGGQAPQAGAGSEGIAAGSEGLAKSSAPPELATPHALFARLFVSVKEGTPGQRRSDVNMSPVACATERGGRRGYLAVMLAALLQVISSQCRV
jgi:hypothetical protein